MRRELPVPPPCLFPLAATTSSTASRGTHDARMPSDTQSVSTGPAAAAVSPRPAIVHRIDAQQVLISRRLRRRDVVVAAGPAGVAWCGDET